VKRLGALHPAGTGFGDKHVFSFHATRGGLRGRKFRSQSSPPGKVLGSGPCSCPFFKGTQTQTGRPANKGAAVGDVE